MEDQQELAKYDKNYGDNRLCVCGHPYYRHFDTYDDMSPVGCKYCECFVFVSAETEEDKLLKELKELDASFDYLCKTEGVKDAGHRWIEFTDKWNAFKKMITTYSPYRQIKELNPEWVPVMESLINIYRKYANDNPAEDHVIDHARHIIDHQKLIDKQGISDADEKEVMMKAFDKVRRIFQGREWIMEGRGSYRYDDDRYKEEVRYMYDEFDALYQDTWNNIKSKTFEYRNKIVADYIVDCAVKGQADFNTICRWMMDFAVSYHKSEQKDIANDAAEFLSDRMKPIEEEKDLLALNFATWLFGPEGQMYKATGMSAYALLQKYKDRPYIDVSNPKNN